MCGYSSRLTSLGSSWLLSLALFLFEKLIGWSHHYVISKVNHLDLFSSIFGYLDRRCSPPLKELFSLACNNQTVYFWSAVFTMVSQQPKNQGAEIGRKFEALEKQLKTKTQNPEEVDFLKQRMLTMPITINEMRGEIDQTEVRPPVWVWSYNFFFCSIL